MLTPELQEEVDHEASMCSPFTFEFTPSGIADIVRVRCGKESISLTLDDDGELISEGSETA